MIMAKRVFLQLAHTFDPKRHAINGWFVSQKLDGMRCFFDGGVTRGMKANDVPWANVEKDARLINTSIATGLWSRYGKVIYAPNDFLDQLPEFPLDGELYAGVGRQQFVMSTVKHHRPGPEWSEIMYSVFDTPPLQIVFADGTINEPQYRKTFKGCLDWYEQHVTTPLVDSFISFESAYKWLSKELTGSRNLELVHQERLDFGTANAQTRIDDLLEQVIDAGGEGLVLRKYATPWTNTRTYDCLKVKTYEDDEAKVIGYTAGRETDKGSKLLGMMGALVTEYKGQRFELSGFTDEERCLNNDEARDWARQNPGKDLPMPYYALSFPLGTIVTFKYRELTDKGIPKEGRFFRKFDA
jgi:DNA ligase-1